MAASVTLSDKLFHNTAPQFSRIFHTPKNQEAPIQACQYRWLISTTLHTSRDPYKIRDLNY